MKSKIVQGPNKKPRRAAETIITTQNKDIKTENTILKLENTILKLKQKILTLQEEDRILKDEIKQMKATPQKITVEFVGADDNSEKDKIKQQSNAQQ